LRRLVVALGVLAGTTLAGALGYVLVEGWSFADALFMTVTTLATVGYGEVRPLSPAGRWYTMALIVAGVGTTLYVLATMAELLLEGSLREVFQRRAMQRRIDAFHGHIVVCGYGRFGRVVVEELSRAGESVVVVEKDPARFAELERAGVPGLLGSAATDEVLERAGIRRARAIVVATSSDADNMFVTLTARELNPALEIHARGEGETALRRLRRAGADHVTAVYLTAGQRAAASILQPTVVDVLELARPRQGAPVDLEEIRVAAGSPLVGRGLAAVEAEVAAVRVVALKRAGESVRVVPEPATSVGADDHLVVIGEREALQRLAALASAKADAAP
jgi:voltage-gated potassium channel